MATTLTSGSATDTQKIDYWFARWCSLTAEQADKELCDHAWDEYLYYVNQPEIDSTFTCDGCGFECHDRHEVGFFTVCGDCLGTLEDEARGVMEMAR